MTLDQLDALFAIAAALASILFVLAASVAVYLWGCLACETRKRKLWEKWHGEVCKQLRGEIDCHAKTSLAHSETWHMAAGMAGKLGQIRKILDSDPDDKE